MKKYSVGIIGSYGGHNMGDEAILASIIFQLRSSLEQVSITVFTDNEEDTKARHHVDKVVPILKYGRNEVLPYLQNLDLLIVGGGGILFDSWVQKKLWLALFAKEHNIKVMFYAIGSAPMAEQGTKDLVKEAVTAADIVTVREASAKLDLEKLGVHREILVTADPAFLLQPEPLTMNPTLEHYLDEKPIVGMSVREPGPAAPDIDATHYHALLADAADYMVNRFGVSVIFIPMEPHVQDTQHAHAVIAKMRLSQKAHVLTGNYSSGQLLSLVSHFSLSVGMRLHFLIFSALSGVPFISLPYASKVGGFVEEMNIAMPPLRDVTSGTLLSFIDRAWDTRKELKEHIRKHLPALKDRARENNRLALKLLEE